MHTLIELESKIRDISERARHHGATMVAERLSSITLLLTRQRFGPLLLDLIPRLLDPTQVRQEIAIATARRIERWYIARNTSMLLLFVFTFLVLLLAIGAYLGWFLDGFRSIIPLSLFLSILADFALFSFWSFCIWRIQWSKYRSEQVSSELALQLQDLTREFLITAITDPNLPLDSSGALNLAADLIVEAVQQLLKANTASVQNIQMLSNEVALRTNSFDERIKPTLLRLDDAIKEFYYTMRDYHQMLSSVTSDLAVSLHSMETTNRVHLDIQRDLSTQIRELNEVQRNTADMNETIATSISTVAQSIVNIAEQITHQQQRILSDTAQRSASPDESGTRYDFDVYLCYDSKNRSAVEAIGEKLKANGISPWFDEWEIAPGMRLHHVLEEQLSHIKSVAVFIGKEGIGPWQNREQRAILREFVEKNHPVIPILLPECDKREPELPAFLKSTTWVDFRQKNPDPLQRLIWSIIGKKVKP